MSPTPPTHRRPRPIDWWHQPDGPANDANATPPQLLPAERQDVVDAIRRRIRTFTAPQWTNFAPTDAGYAFARLFSEMLEPLLRRTNRLTEKAASDFLDLAGVDRLPSTPAAAVVRFVLSASADESVAIAAGFMTGAAGRGGDRVIFETVDSLVAVPGELKALLTPRDIGYDDNDPVADGDIVRPFGVDATVPSDFWIGLASPAGEQSYRSLSLAFRPAPGGGRPSPISSAAAPAVVRLRWSVLTERGTEAAVVLRDQTAQLTRPGVVELEIDADWTPRLHPQRPTLAPMRWLRVQLVGGQYDQPPALLTPILLNAATVTAAQTYRNEAPVAITPPGRAENAPLRLRLAHTPVISDSLVVQVQQSALADSREADTKANSSDDSTKPFATWTRVDDLQEHDGDARVYELDAAEGVLSFGDGVHGALPPREPGAVRVARYRAGGGRAGGVAAKQITTLVSSAPLLTRVENPWPATGGVEREANDAALLRGPAEIRTRDAAVTVADYELLVPRVPGVDVRRVIARANVHADFPGVPIPGVVSLYIVPRPAEKTAGPPLPDAVTLGVIATYVRQQWVASGAEVIVAAPRYRAVSVEAVVVATVDADPVTLERLLSSALSAYLDPITGGGDGRGWPLGGTVAHQDLVRRINLTPGVAAVRRASVTFDGDRRAPCTDIALGPDELVWPGGHLIRVQQPEEARR